MNIGSSAFLVLALALPAPLVSQDAPPSRLADLELARSRRCVPALARLSTVNAELEPLARRAQRLQALDNAVGVEDSIRVAPFDASDAVEAAVQQWFTDDGALARRYLESRDAKLQDERLRARAAIIERVQAELRAVAEQGQARIDAASDVRDAALECEDAILVRSAVLEVCDTAASPVCEDARAGEAAERFTFVDAAEDLWDVEQLRPWSKPSPLRVAPNGALVGARIGVLARRANLVLVMGLEPMIRTRDEVGAEQAAQLDSMGFTFDDPRFVMAPALALQLNLSEPIGGETHYLLHFGDLSDPAGQVVWSAAAGGAVQAVFPASPNTLARLAAGETVSLTAVRVDGDDARQAEAVFSLELNGVGQAQAVRDLLTYMGGGQLARDLARLVPREEVGGR